MAKTSDTAGPLMLMRRGREQLSLVLPTEAQEKIRRLLRLSPREFDIALCIMDGRTHGDTARLLGCSPHTVNSHLRRVFAKLHVDSKAAVVACLFAAFVELSEFGEWHHDVT